MRKIDESREKIAYFDTKNGAKNVLSTKQLEKQFLELIRECPSDFKHESLLSEFLEIPEVHTLCS